MHYCVLLITKELPSESKIEKILQPYNYEDIKYDEETGELIKPYPIFTYDWFCIGGRYTGSLKLKIDKNNEYYNWNFISNGGRNKRLFYSKLLSELQKTKGAIFFEENYYSSMGSRDGFLYVDGAKIDDLLNFDDVNCFICIDSNENVIVRETWDGHNLIEDKQFDEKLAKIKENSKGMFATILDIHD